MIYSTPLLPIRNKNVGREGDIGATTLHPKELGTCFNSTASVGVVGECINTQPDLAWDICTCIVGAWV